MDIPRIIDELVAERAHIDEAITILETLSLRGHFEESNLQNLVSAQRTRFENSSLPS